MKNSTTGVLPITNHTEQPRLPYASPTLTVYGDMAELTRGAHPSQKFDSEIQQGQPSV